MVMPSKEPKTNGAAGIDAEGGRSLPHCRCRCRCGDGGPRIVGSAADFYGADEATYFGGDLRRGRRWWDRSDPAPGRLVLVDADGLAPAARQRASGALTPAKRKPKSAAHNPLAAELVQGSRKMHGSVADWSTPRRSSKSKKHSWTAAAARCDGASSFAPMGRVLACLSSL
jgi:hypothetical protein